jgi:predicted nucleic acid-binding protein
MYTHKVLVDSSVWIDYFKGKQTETLDKLLIEDLICTNELILTELIPILKKSNQVQIIEGLLAIPKVPLKIDWLILRKMQLENINNGINKVGIPDLIILQQVIEQKIPFLSFDKHFKLMQENFKFDLIE